MTTWDESSQDIYGSQNFFQILIYHELADVLVRTAHAVFLHIIMYSSVFICLTNFLLLKMFSFVSSSFTFNCRCFFRNIMFLYIVKISSWALQQVSTHHKFVRFFSYRNKRMEELYISIVCIMLVSYAVHINQGKRTKHTSWSYL